MAQNKKNSTEKVSKEEKSGKLTLEDEKLIGALSYLWIFSVVIYILRKDDDFVVFHAKQGMVITAFSFSALIPLIGWVFSWLIAPVSIILFIVGGAKAYAGEKFRIPVVANIADRINF